MQFILLIRFSVYFSDDLSDVKIRVIWILSWTHTRIRSISEKARLCGLHTLYYFNEFYSLQLYIYIISHPTALFVPTNLDKGRFSKSSEHLKPVNFFQASFSQLFLHVLSVFSPREQNAWNAFRVFRKRNSDSIIRIFGYSIYSHCIIRTIKRTLKRHDEARASKSANICSL